MSNNRTAVTTDVIRGLLYEKLVVILTVIVIMVSTGFLANSE